MRASKPGIYFVQPKLNMLSASREKPKADHSSNVEPQTLLDSTPRAFAYTNQTRNGRNNVTADSWKTLEVQN